MDDKITVDIQIVDETDVPVPYAIIWRYTVPDGPDNPKTAYRQFSMTDLWRITQRYFDSHEFAAFNHVPVKGMFVSPMADAEGRAQIVLTVKENFRIPRDEVKEIGYSFMRRGYEPAKLALDVTDGRDRYTITVRLRRDPTHPAGAEPAYLTTYDRVRYELSDWRRNADASVSNHERIDRLWTDMEQAAQQALAADDKPAAATIYARMEHMPAVKLVNGKPVGWTQSIADKPQGKAMIERAIALDPDRPHFKMRELQLRMSHFFRRVRYPWREQDYATLRAFVAEEERLFAREDAIWLLLRAGLHYDYERLGLWDKARAEIYRIHDYEPRAFDLEQRLHDLDVVQKRRNKTASN